MFRSGAARSRERHYSSPSVDVAARESSNGEGRTAFSSKENLCASILSLAPRWY